MSDISSEELRKEVAAVLKTADLSVASSKKVREQVEKKLDICLTNRKKEFDAIIMDYINEQHEGMPKDDAEDQENGQEEEERADSESSEYEAPRKPPPAKKKKTAAAPGDKPRRSTGFTKAINLSPELSALMGADSLPRHEVVKKLWAIIKERNLYDPKNKQYAICDDELRKIMKVKRFRTFGMLKHLKPHFLA